LKTMKHRELGLSYSFSSYVLMHFCGEVTLVPYHHTRHRQAMDRGIDWLLQRINSDGSVNPVNEGIGCYCKLPYALASRGELGAACDVLSWVRKNNFTPKGDFDGPIKRDPVLTGLWSYPNAWLVCGAHKAGQFDLSHRGVDFLLTMQDPKSGGFYAMRRDMDKEDIVWKPGGRYSVHAAVQDNATQQLMCTAMAGLACLYTGRLRQARAAGDFLLRLWDLQPDPVHKVYYMYKNDVGLLTRFKDEHAQAYVIDSSREKQYYFQLGIAAAFLSSLFLATGNQDYLTGGSRYLDFVFGCEKDKFSTPQSGKLGWGAAYLARITGKNEYRQVAETIRDYLIDLQSEEGCWLPPETGPVGVATIDVTSEFVSLLNEIQVGLSGGKPLR